MLYFRQCLCLSLILVWGTMVEFGQCQSISVIGQKTIRSFTPYAVTVTNTLPERVFLELELSGHEMKQTKQITLKRESEQRIAFEIGTITGDNYNLSIHSLNSSVAFREEVELIVDPRSFSIFIQIDKPIYKPGDIIKFRVIVVDKDTRPVKNVPYVEISLQDSSGTSIREWKFAKLNNGVFESSMQLPSSPDLGVWNLTVESPEFQAKNVKGFEVKPYVLPKFWIKVFPTETPLLHEKSIKLTVESEYTFGRPVKGYVVVDLHVEENRRLPSYSAMKHFEQKSSFDFILEDEVDMDYEMDYHDVFVNVTVNDKVTNTTLYIWEPIRVYRNEFEIFLTKSRAMFRPGMPFPMQILFKDRKGLAVGDGQNVTCRIIYRQSNDDEVEEEVSGIINSKGVLSLTNIVPSATAVLMTIQVSYQTTEFEEHIDAMMSTSNQYLRISLPEGYRLRPNREVNFEIICSEPIKYLTYVTVARGVIVDSDIVKVYGRKKKIIRYKLKPYLAPRARMIVFSTNEKFMIWDSLELNFETFDNDFKLFLDESKYSPGQEAFIDVEADPDSFIALHAIDQSVLLLNDEWNDLTKTNIIKELDSFDTSNEFDHMQEYGLFARSTSKIDLEPNTLARSGLGYQNSKMSLIPRRTAFPETWLWQNLTMAGKNNKLIKAQIPDSITSWHVTGFALSPTTGLSIFNDPVTIAVKKSFYIVTDVPYSIRRDEVTPIKVSIFSSIDEILIIDVSLHNQNDEFDFVDHSENSTTRLTKYVIMSGISNRQVVFLVKAKKVGDITIQVDAFNAFANDSVKQIIRVKPESQLHKKVESRLINHKVYDTKNHEIQLYFPRRAIEGSINIEFTLDASFFSIPYNTVMNFTRSSKKNTEESLFDFASNVIILDYIVNSKENGDSYKDKIIQSLRRGYNDQLSNKLLDNSFGTRKSGRLQKGSIFITALTAKSFSVAAKHIDHLVDMKHVRDALGWLASKQRTDGSFVEVGEQIHSKLQGVDKSSSYALTAYVLATFLEIGDLALEYATNMDSAIEYLAVNYNRTEDVYALALAAYALSFKKHDIGRKCLDKVMDHSVHIDGEVYWNMAPFSTEIASYVVLAFDEFYSVIEANRIVRYLIKNSFGVSQFGSVNNALILLQAVCEYAIKSAEDTFDYRVTLRFNNFAKNYDINSHSALNVYNYTLPKHLRKISIEISGKGYGLLQVVYQYRLELEDSKQGFEINLKMMDNSTYDVQHLKVCTKNKLTDIFSQSNLAYVEVFLPSGLHVKDEKEIKDLASVNKITLVEIRSNGTFIRVFYTSLGASESCFIVTAERRHEEKLHRPSYVIVYDSINKDKFAIKQYDGIVKQPCDICQDEDCATMTCHG